MKKLFKEFKDFISKGSVIDLAVGMIIGAAFTAIVTALVNGILKPLINCIPLSSSGTGLQTVLKPPVLGENNEIITEAVILDWGGVISAILTFIITALVLFAIIKAFNKVKSASETASQKIKELASKKSEDAQATVAAEEVAASEEAVAEEALAVEEIKESSPTTEELLAEIVELLKNQQK